MGELYGLHSDFDIGKHKENFVSYLEVVIDSDGKIMYAVPSHQEKVAAMACEKLGVSKQELGDMCPREYYFDYITWLCMMAEAVAVWNKHCIAPHLTRKQAGALRKLKMAGLYKGVIPKIL